MIENESCIVEWLFKFGNLSCVFVIKDVVEVLVVFEVMIVKVLKLLGFSGFCNLCSVLEDYFIQLEQVLFFELVFDEVLQDVVNKVFNIILCIIMEGQLIVNVDEIYCVVCFFYQVRQWDLYGVGGLNVICVDVQYKFLCIGVCCQVYFDVYIMMMFVLLLQEGDVVLVVIYFG